MRLNDKFSQLKQANKKAFIAYVPFGFPNPQATKEICLSLEQAGVDAIELGIPFSDPLADGPIIQRATTKALAKGADINNFFKTLKQLKQSLTVPIVIMTYYNPIFSYGLEKFFKQLKQAGASAILVVDLPLEEAKGYISQARKFAIDTVFFITPTTQAQRIKKIVSLSRGFIYYISVTGITGPKNIAYRSIAKQINKIKKISKLPVCVGFGIHSQKQVKAVNKFADGVIVGSNLVKFIENNHSKKDFLSRLKRHTKALCIK